MTPLLELGAIGCAPKKSRETRRTSKSLIAKSKSRARIISLGQTEAAFSSAVGGAFQGVQCIWSRKVTNHTLFLGCIEAAVPRQGLICATGLYMCVFAHTPMCTLPITLRKARLPEYQS